jgi:hypothetical protein
MNSLFRQGSRVAIGCRLRLSLPRHPTKAGGFMAYPQDLEGKYIDYRVDPGGAVPGLAGTIKDDATTGARVAVYRSKISGPPQPDQFENMNRPWNFTFLKYSPGVVTTAGLQTAIMTGPMSGCYLFTYTKDGQQKLAHVGTDTPGSERTVGAKKAWRELVTKLNGEAMGVSPSDCFTLAECQAAMFPGGYPPQIMGSFETRPYAILLAPVPAGMAPPTMRSLLKVAKIKPMTLQPWSTIKNSANFR